MDSKALSDHDFGRNIIPQMIKNGKKVYVYNFVDEEKDPQYWRDIGTRDAYYQANMDLVKANPEFDLYNREWPVRTYHEQYPPARMISSRDQDGQEHEGVVADSLIAGGCIIRGASVTGSVCSPSVKIKKDARIEDSVLMEGVVIGEGAKIRNAIIDKQVIIPAGTEIGYDLNLDRKRFEVTASGITSATLSRVHNSNSFSLTIAVIGLT